MERADVLRLARQLAEVDIQGGFLADAVATFVTTCQREKLDPPLHHASVTQAVLLAHDGNTEGVRKWISDPR